MGTRRWFLSYNSQDLKLVEPLEERLRDLPDTELFYAPKDIRAGGYWLPRLAEAIDGATAFLLVIGENGIGQWQILEYNEALDKRVKSPDFALVVLLLEGKPAPGLPFLRQLHWIVAPDFAAEQVIGRIVDATAGAGSRPGELWRHTAPYRGLAAMTEADADFFFGRAEQTVDIIKALAAAPDCVPLLIGNSGVGKSSLAQAGVLAALKRHAFPEHANDPGAWPSVFAESRRWVYLTLQPGRDPLRALVEPFLRTWQLDTTSTDARKRRTEWIDDLAGGKVGLRDLLDATEERLETDLRQPRPPAFFLYVDQGEELYVRAGEEQRRLFSKILADGLRDPRLRVMMSMRSDFLGALQNDAPLFAARRQIDVPPLRETELAEIVSRPAALLSARFETDGLAEDIARRAAEESVKDAGALPLLSYLLDDMWTRMVQRGDGVLRLPAQAVELGGVLAERADGFLARHPYSQERLRRVLTLSLATVRADGEPTRRRAPRSEFSDEDWRLICELADHPYRLLVTVTPEGRPSYAEVAHEAIFRRWKTLRDWVVAEREFLIWRTRLEADFSQWEATPELARSDALLMGLPLAQAESWLAKRPEDLAKAHRNFIELSTRRDAQEQAQRESERRQKEQLRRRLLWTAAAAAVVMAVAAGFSVSQWSEAAAQRNEALISQSRFLADLANRRVRDGDAATGMLLALEALPDTGIDRPLVEEAEAALFNTYQNLRETIVLGHNSPVWNAMFAWDGRHIVAATEDETVRLWNAANLNQHPVLAGHTGSARIVAFDLDSKRILNASGDGTAQLWDAETGAFIAALQGHTDPIWSGTFSPDSRLIATASEDGTVRLWDAQTGQPTSVLKEHTDGVLSASFSPNSRLVVTASRDKTARLWDAATGQQMAVMEGHAAAVRYAAFGHDEKRVMTASEDGTARLWNLEAGKWTELRGHTAAVWTAVLSPDGQRIVTTSDDGAARMWEAETGKEVAVLREHRGPVKTAAFSRDGRYIVTASDDRTARLWDAASGKPAAVFRGHTGRVASAAFNTDGSRIVTTSLDGTARFWRVNSDTTIMLSGHRSHVRGVAFDADGGRVVTASDDGTARIWDAQTGKQLVALTGHEAPVTSAAFSRDGRRVVTSSEDKSVRLWDAETGKPSAPLLEHGAAVRSAVFAADGRRVVTACDDGTARIWDAHSGKEIVTLKRKGPANRVSSAAFSPGDRHVVTAAWDGYARIWNAESGEETKRLKGHDGQMQKAAFSADGLLVVTASSDNTARLWDVETGKEVAKLDGHAGSVWSAAFRPDGKRVITASDDNTARIWNVATGKQVAILEGHEDAVLSAAFSPDGARVVTGAWDNTARISRVFLTPQALVDQAKQVVPRCLTEQQRKEAFLDPRPPAWCIEKGKWPYDTAERK